jgi:hypothetical protein
MKNIHILPTDKPSRLTKNNLGKLIKLRGLQHQEVNENQYIYITSDEEIKDGEYGLSRLGEIIKFHSGYDYRYYAKIILTTDQDLIKDGVQAIDNEFLEWFVKNPSCEMVETERFYTMSQSTYSGIEYEIIIPKEEPKKETFDETVERELSFIHKSCRNMDFDLGFKTGMLLGDKPKQPIHYDESEVLELLLNRPGPYLTDDEIKEWFNNVKKT